MTTASVHVQAEQSAQQRIDHHGRRPDLLRRSCRQRLKIVAGKNFGHMSQRPIQSQQSIGPQVRIGGQRAMISILANRRPSGEQRPHRSKMISAWIVFRVVRRKNPHAPVGLLIGAGELSQSCFAPDLR